MFGDLWNADPACSYGFASFNPRDGTCVLSSRPAIPEDILAPLPAPKVIRTGLDLPHVGMQAVIRSLAESQTRSYQARGRIESNRGGRFIKKSKFNHSTRSIGYRAPTPFPFARIPESTATSSVTIPASSSTLITPPPPSGHPTPAQAVEIPQNVESGISTLRVGNDGLIEYDSVEGARGESDADATMVENKTA